MALLERKSVGHKDKEKNYLLIRTFLPAIFIGQQKYMEIQNNSLEEFNYF